MPAAPGRCRLVYAFLIAGITLFQTAADARTRMILFVMGSRIHPRKGDPGPKGGGDIGVDDQPDDGIAGVVGHRAGEVRHVDEEIGLEAVLGNPLEDGSESGPPAALRLFQADGPIEERYRFGGADFGVAVRSESESSWPSSALRSATWPPVP